VVTTPDLRDVLSASGFRRLLSARLVSQLGDGLLQAGLASYVLFSPERQATGAEVAGAFAVLLLPYSAIGPFAGVLIDRWRRRQILVYANIVRALLIIPIAWLVLADNAGFVFGAIALACLGVNRFYLAALNAALPHVVHPSRLVTANALSTTSGTVCTAIGAGLGVGLRFVAGTGPHATGAIVVVAGLGYLVSAGLATLLRRDQLGPDPDEEASPSLRLHGSEGKPGLRDGLAYLATRSRAWQALIALGVFRMAFGAATVIVVLLQRDSFHRPSDANGGLAGVAVTFLAVAIGIPLGAAMTPLAVRRWGVRLWIPTMLGVAAVALAASIPFVDALILASAFLLGFSGQAAKVSVDATVQAEVNDAHRGLVFALYDVLFNVAFVVAAVLAAAFVPPDGRSIPVLAASAASLLIAAWWYHRVTPAVVRS
jgi:MFS family permease